MKYLHDVSPGCRSSFFADAWDDGIEIQDAQGNMLAVDQDKEVAIKKAAHKLGWVRQPDTPELAATV